MLFDTITIVGVGLIGGSIGLAAKKRGVCRQVRGVGRDQAKLRHAIDLGAIDASTLELAQGVSNTGLVVFCTPVDRIAEQALSVRTHYLADTIITDAGSTKSAIVQAIEPTLAASFVGSHPLAGSEKQGVEHARADLFVERWTVLTPTARTNPQALAKVERFWQALGSKTRCLSPDEHDRALALTSHLPHLLAAALAGILPADWTDLAATGFRDTTRVAAGDPGVWTPIFQHNRAAVQSALDRLEERLSAFRQAIANDDAAALDQLLAQGKKVRDALGS